MKCTTRAQALKRYGAIDFASRQWPQKATWMGMVQVPKGWFPNWKVLDTKHPVQNIYCNKDIHVPLLQALKAIYDGGLGEHLKTFDGCFNIRMVRGSSASPSCHSYGLALDINAATNGLGKVPTLHKGIVKAFKDAGFDWGGDFKKRKDGMHFSYGWE